MRVTFNMNAKSVEAFDAICEASISKVGRGTKKALIEACRVISEDSLNQVPRDTDTLANSQFWEVTGYYKTGFNARIGYGGNGNPINPKTGQPASRYMLAVHENLSAKHPIGKAKFLEDPIKAYAAERHPRTVMRYIREELST